MEKILTDLWIAIIAFFLLSYAISDGADLGLGMICLFKRNERDRSLIMGAIESTWHTNQTWLVIVGGMIFGAFPFFYGTVFTALYIPLMALLFALIIRGLALDYHAHAKHKSLAAWSFAVGSLLVAVTQGFALGGFLGGIQVPQAQVVGGIWNWLTPFSALVTAGVIFGDLLLGATFLILKTRGTLQALGFRYAWFSSAVLLPISGGVYAWMFIKYPHMYDKLTRLPDAYWVASPPALAVLAGLIFIVSLWRRYERLPLLMAAAVVLFSFTGISVALYPYMIPSVIFTQAQIVKAASSMSTLIFMTAVMAVLIPIILIYNAYNQFWVFRGKISDYLEEVEEDAK